MKEDQKLTALQERIGQKIVELRKKKGYTSHEDFATDYEFPRMQYWRIEKGRTNLTLRTLLKVTDIHNLTVEEFFNEILKESKKK